MTNLLQTNYLDNANPCITLLKGHDKRLRAGYPWIYSNEIDWRPALKLVPPGTLAQIRDARGEDCGLALFNPKSLIIGRMLCTDSAQTIDREFFKNRLQAALNLRARFFTEPYYRLIHAEADGMPGLVIDRFDDVLVCEVNSAGMQTLLPEWMGALEELLSPRAVYLKNDSAARLQEGLTQEEGFYKGEIGGPVTVRENDVEFLADIVSGQKTGWFYDQRANRAMVAALSKGKTVLDLYSYLGGFAMAAAKAGASRVTAVDRSEQSMGLAKKAAAQNGLSNCEFLTEQVFPWMEKQTESKKKYDIVVADPPAFAKTAKDVGSAKTGYRKLAQLSAGAVAPGGILFIASCSYHMKLDDFTEQVAGGIGRAGRTAKILRVTGADADHPAHYLLPQTAYLKGLLLQLN